MNKSENKIITVLDKGKPVYHKNPALNSQIEDELNKIDVLADFQLIESGINESIKTGREIVKKAEELKKKWDEIFYKGGK